MKKNVRKIEDKILNSLKEAIKNENYLGIIRQLKYLEALNIINKQNSNKKTRISYLPFGISILCLIIIYLASTTNGPSTTCFTNIKTSGLKAGFIDGLDLEESIILNSFSAKNLKSIKLVSKNISYINKEDLSIEFADSNFIRLNELLVSKESSIELSLELDAANLWVSMGKIAANLTSNKGAVFVSYIENNTQITKTHKFDNVELIEILSNNSKHENDNISLTLGGSIELSIVNTNFNDIDFIKEYPINSGKFRSQIKSGTILLPEYDNTHSLLKFNNVIIDSIKPGSLSLNMEDGIINLDIESNIDGLKIGPYRFEKNKFPSLAKYLFSSQELAFFIGAITTLYGFIWGTRNSIFK